MSDLRIEREFAVTPARLFQVLSTRAYVVQWWGHESWTMRDETLDFTRTGPWHSAMLSAEGTLFAISGQVTRVEPIEVIGFTWGWDAPPEMVTGESHVTFTVQESPKGAKLIIDHRELTSDEIAARHKQGWEGPLAQLTRVLAAAEE